MSKVAVVTGSNKGIGLAIVRALCKQYTGDVFLTSRNIERGEAAIKLLEGEGLKPKFHQLDIEDVKSIEALRDSMVTSYGGIDVLVNNAGFAFKNASTVPFGEQAEVTIGINYFSTLQECNILLPHIKPGGRVVNVSSMASQFSLKKCSPELQSKFRSETIDYDELTALMNDFIEHAKKGNLRKSGYSNSAYGMSKVGVAVMSRIQARKLREEGRNDILLNACCPGWVRTDMAGPKATKSPDEGADTPVYLALLPQESQLHGNFVSERVVNPW